MMFNEELRGLVLLVKAYDFLSGYWQDCLQEANEANEAKK